MRYSYSALSRYTGCARRYQYERVLKLAPPQQTENPAAVRGTLIHEMAEHYILGKTQTLPTELKKFERVLANMKVTGCTPEAHLALTANLAPCDKDAPEARYHGIIDTVEFVPPAKTIILGDWKTGEVRDYSSQLSYYAMLSIPNYPDYDFFKARVRYVDKGKAEDYHTYSRDDLHSLAARWNAVIDRIENDKVFAPNPSTGCAFCPYSKKRGGPCKW